MGLNEEQIKTLGVLAHKEQLLSELIVWLKAKGLYEQAAKDIYGLPTKKEE